MQEEHRADGYPVDRVVVIDREDLSVSVLETEGLVDDGDVEVAGREFAVLIDDLALLEGRDDIDDAVPEFPFDAREFALREGEDGEEECKDGKEKLFHGRNN